MENIHVFVNNVNKIVQRIPRNEYKMIKECFNPTFKFVSSTHQVFKGNRTIRPTSDSPITTRPFALICSISITL